MLEDLPYIRRYDADRVQKMVTFKVVNPEHPDTFSAAMGTEPNEQFWEGATWAVNALGPQRNALIADFLYGVKQLEVNDNAEPLVGLVHKIFPDDLNVTIEHERPADNDQY